MVDGIGPIPGSMFGPLGLEVGDLKNPQLNWKTVTKGKRSKKSVIRNSNGRSKLASESPVRVVDFSGSDSEKYVETSIWPQLSNESVCVPLKKRRHILRSPSPPLQASLQNADQLSPHHQTPSLSVDLEPLSDNKNGCSDNQHLGSYRKAQRSAGRSRIFKDQVQYDTLSGSTGTELDDSDDFSGIALLAATACSNNTGESDNVKGGVMVSSSTLGRFHTSMSSMQSGDSFSCSAPVCSQLEDKECQFYPEASVNQIGDNNNQRVTTIFVSSKVDIPHQDLCTLMEACKEHEASFNCIQKEKVHREEECATNLDCKSNANDVKHMAVGPTDETTASFELKVDPSDDVGSSLGCAVSTNSEHQIGILEVTGLEASERKNDIQMKEEEYPPKAFELPENGTTFEEGMFKETFNTVVKNSGTTSEQPSHSFTRREGIISLDVSARGQSIVLGEGKDETEKVFLADLLQVNNAMDPGSKDLIFQPDKDLVSDEEVRTVCSMQEPIMTLIYDDSHKLDASGNEDRSQFNSTQNTHELQMDYDSPYEDGELRGSVLYSCDGNELEDGEHECVNYESDGRVGDDLESAYYHCSEDSQATGKEYSLADQIYETSFSNMSLGLNKELEDSIENIETEGKKEPILGFGNTDESSSPMVVGKYDDSGRRVCPIDYIDVSDVGGSHVEEIGSKVISDKLQSCTKGRTSDSRDDVCSPRSRSGKVDISRYERGNSPDRHVTRYRSSLNKYRHTEGNMRLNYWDSRHGNQSRFRVEDHQPPRSRSPMADSIDRPRENYQAEGTAHPFAWRRSPVKGLDFCGASRKAANIRSNRRGRSENICGGYFSGLREEYDEPVVDDAEPYMRRCLSRREWSSTSSHRTPRSRAHSPTWQSLQDRNLVPSRQSGSPEFRSESCMERMRGPFQRFKFTAGYGEDFVSSPRGQFSQTQSNKLARERNFLTHPARRQKSPGDVFRQVQRSDTRTSSGRLHSDDYFRPVRRSGRFPLPVSNRDDLAENCSNGRQDERSRRIYGMRDSDISTNSRRSRFESRDNFEDGHSSTGKEHYRRGQRDFACDYEESYFSSRGQLSPSHSSRWTIENNFVGSPLRHRRSPMRAFRQTERLDPAGLTGQRNSDDSLTPFKRPRRFSHQFSQISAATENIARDVE